MAHKIGPEVVRLDADKHVASMRRTCPTPAGVGPRSRNQTTSVSQPCDQEPDGDDHHECSHQDEGDGQVPPEVLRWCRNHGLDCKSARHAWPVRRHWERLAGRQWLRSEQSVRL